MTDHEWLRHAHAARNVISIVRTYPQAHGLDFCFSPTSPTGGEIRILRLPPIKHQKPVATYEVIE